MPDATELCSTSDLKTMLAITTSGEDTMLALLKAAGEKFVKTFCGRDFIIPSTPYTEYYDGDGSNVLRLDQAPIVSVTSIHSDPARLFESASLIPASDLIGDAKSLRLGWLELLTYKFLKGLKSTKVVYSAGWSTIPEDLSFAVKTLICHQYKVVGKKSWDETARQFGDVNITISPNSIPKNALDILKSYRRSRVV
jgi:hypothetical protein